LHREIYGLYSKTNITGMIKTMRIRWAGNMACVGENRNTHRSLNGKTEGKGPFEKPRLRREANIKMYLYTE